MKEVRLSPTKNDILRAVRISNYSFLDNQKSLYNFIKDTYCGVTADDFEEKYAPIFNPVLHEYNEKNHVFPKNFSQIQKAIDAAEKILDAEGVRKFLHPARAGIDNFLLKSIQSVAEPTSPEEKSALIKEVQKIFKKHQKD